MLLAIDAQYDDEKSVAGVGAVLFNQWSDSTADEVFVRMHHGVEPYVSGEFYRRELPCLMPLIGQILSLHPVTSIVVDGHVDVRIGQPGLGRHLFDALHSAVEIIGVAKSPFADSHALPLCRGASKQPLWITSTGDADEACALVASMHGRYRFPTLLKQADQIARARVTGLMP